MFVGALDRNLQHLIPAEVADGVEIVLLDAVNGQSSKYRGMVCLMAFVTAVFYCFLPAS
jgi:hypothetical protein